MNNTELIRALESRYPNDIFVLESQKEEDKVKYIAKMELIKEIKQMLGVKDDK